MKFLIVEPSPLPILIPLGPKYSPQDDERPTGNKNTTIEWDDGGKIDNKNKLILKDLKAQHI